MDRETRICLVGKAVLPRGPLLLKPQNHGSPEPVANIPQQLLQKTSPRVQAVKTGMFLRGAVSPWSGNGLPESLHSLTFFTWSHLKSDVISRSR